MIKFLSDEINEPVIKQYLDTSPKMLPVTVLILVILLKFLLTLILKSIFIILTFVDVVNLVIFAKEATLAARKEMAKEESTFGEEEEEEVALLLHQLNLKF